MSKFPSAYSVYNLSENFMKSIDGSFRGTGNDTSLTNSKILHIGSAATERIIAFTAFIESYKINLQKEVEEKKDQDKSRTYFTDIAGNLSISLTINIPAHSVNESANNLAKIEELQRLASPGSWSSNTNVSTITNITKPILLVHFANLITNSRKTNSFKIDSFKDLLQKGFPCFIDSVSFNPDVDAGFFEFHHEKPKDKKRNFLYPKNIKLSLELKYESRNSYNADNTYMDKITIESFMDTGHFKRYVKYVKEGEAGYVEGGEKWYYKNVDDGMFPFHSNGIKNYGETLQTMSIKKMNELTNKDLGEKIDSFIFIGFDYGNDTEKKKSITAYDGNKNFLDNNEESSPMRFVMFKPVITDFSRKLNFENKQNESTKNLPDSSVFSLLESSTFKTLDYEVGFDIVSTSLSQAYQNCAKIQYLMRLFLKKNYDSSSVLTEKESKTSISNTVKVYIPSFIESGKGGEYISYDLGSIYESKAISLNFVNLDVSVDMESGFYEDGEKLFPKKITVKCTFKYGEDGNPIYGYNYSIPDEKAPQWLLNTPSTKPPDSTDPAAPWLFPYNRKTVKIGGS